MKYQMVCCDVDGTIYREDKTISENTKEAIIKIKEKGVIFVLASGRSKQGVNEVWRCLGFKDYSICYNGNCVYKEDTLIYDQGFRIQQQRAFMQYLQTNHIQAILCTEEKEFIEESLYKTIKEANTEWKNSLKIISRNEYLNFPDEQRFYKVSLHIKDRELAKKTIEECKMLNISLAAAGDDFYDVMIDGHQKKDGVVFLANQLKIARNKIICIGDNENDISMISYAGMGIAMANAEINVKEYADFVCESNENDGVYKSLRMFVL